MKTAATLLQSNKRYFLNNDTQPQNKAFKTLIFGTNSYVTRQAITYKITLRGVSATILTLGKQ